MFFELAQASEVIASDPHIDFIKLLITSIGGLKGASNLAIVAVVIQLLLKLIDLPAFGKIFSNFSAAGKLLLVSGLTMVLGPISLILEGVPLGAALVHSATLSALTVFVHQVYKHFIEKKDILE